jgi:hypothetical protein
MSQQQDQNETTARSLMAQEAGEDSPTGPRSAQQYTIQQPTGATIPSYNGYQYSLLHPGNVLLLTSIPFFAGAFMGYKVPLKSMEEWASTSSSSPNEASGASNKTNSHATRSSAMEKNLSSAAAARSAISDATLPPLEEMSADEARAMASRMAIRAFRIATLGTVATFALVGAVGFYASGYQTLDEAVQGTRRRASSWSRSWQEYFGISSKSSEERMQNHPDVQATRGMTEEQQMQYFYEKYMAEEDTRGSPSTRKNLETKE